MTKAALGSSTSISKEYGMETNAMDLWYTQRPLVETMISKILNCHKLPNGINVIMAIASLGKESQEDANSSDQMAIDLGLMRATVRRTTTISEKRQAKTEYSDYLGWVDPDLLAGKKRAIYQWVEKDGTPAISSPVENSNILAQKYQILKTPIPVNTVKRHLLYQDKSVGNVLSTQGRVNRVFMTSTADGCKTVKVNIRSVMRVNDGDKFAAQHGQKGTNIKIPHVDLMYTEDGMVPNWIINSSAFSSRMTWGVWLEMVFATICAINGRIGDATPFSKQYRKSLYKKLDIYKKNFKSSDPVTEMCDALRYLGLSQHGEHVMYDGVTGIRLKSQIFIAPAYQQRLKHMAADKIRARGRGRIQAQNRQPVEGKSKGGGLKNGEMEKDCLLAHGAVYNIQDRLTLSSDPHFPDICQICSNNVINPGQEHDQVLCKVCGTRGTALNIDSNKTFKLFQHQAFVANLHIKLGVTPLPI
jgi:DNA-directed RNA polymerase beta subunit